MPNAKLPSLVKRPLVALIASLGVFLVSFDGFANSRISCTEIFALKTANPGIVSEDQLVRHVTNTILLVPEFQYIRDMAKKMGLRVWLFGGTASSFLHYVKWDLARASGIMNLQKDRFDFDFTNIFRSTQDLDIVVDADPKAASQFQNALAERFPHFLGSKGNKWEVRTLRHRMGTPGQFGFKEALLNDADFNNQSTDSNSVGMIEISENGEPVIRDLRHWNQADSVFLSDAINNRISYFRSKNHFTTIRARAGENPEILSVLRLLVKAFQYELTFSDNDYRQIKEIAGEFDSSTVTNSAALRRIRDTAKKLILHAVNIEYAVNRLDELGLREKLIRMGNSREQYNFAWWLAREPLRSKEVGQGTGRTAKDLNIQVVAHETFSFMAYESITRAHSGEPNVLISREKAIGESAAYGDGFYTRIGRIGARGTGWTIRFDVNPNAREGSDFKVDGDYIIFVNKKALTIIQESLSLSLDDLVTLAENEREFRIDSSDLGLLEKLKRRLNAPRITDELEKLIHSHSEDDHYRLVRILNSLENAGVSKLISEDVLNSVIKNISIRLAQLRKSSEDSDVLKYIKTVGPILKNSKTFGLTEGQEFIQYLERIIHGRKGLNLRKEALFEHLLNVDNFENQLDFMRKFSQQELNTIAKEIISWDESPDKRKTQFWTKLNKKWSKAIEDGNLSVIETLIEIGFFNINHKNVSQFSILQLAAYYNQRKIVDWLVASPSFNLNERNSLGFTEVEQLRLVGKSQLADEIEKIRPEAKGRPITVRDRNRKKIADYLLYRKGAPIIDFVRIEPGSFLMGGDILTTISKPFEIMSVDVPQRTYRIITQLSGNRDYYTTSPSHYMGERRPVENVSYEMVSSWIGRLNRLSKTGDARTQAILAELFPGHKRGSIYGRPTEAQYEFVLRLGGVAEGNYAHGNGESKLGDYAVYDADSTAAVGSKKPVFYNGKPLYDLHGNVAKWMEDWYGPPQGGKDPVGPLTGDRRIVRGGGWFNSARSLESGYRGSARPESQSLFSVGIRLIRKIEN
ncbi:MAG: hypothetical protein A4S09_12150 [Proteobacteria bacterium SG_bin7]|nr:MAG: hypothetical protein A4S09_12150 [Proteobacteria bacterium SG_bin7]